MIVHGDNKMERLYYNGKHIMRVYKGDKLIYNWYVIPEKEEIWLFEPNIIDKVISNTDWQIIGID